MRAICSLTTGQDFGARSEEIGRSRRGDKASLLVKMSVLHVGVWSVVAGFLFLMPFAGAVLVFDRAALTGGALLPRRARRGGVGRASRLAKVSEKTSPTL